MVISERGDISNIKKHDGTIEYTALPAEADRMSISTPNNYLGILQSDSSPQGSVGLLLSLWACLTNSNATFY